MSSHLQVVACEKFQIKWVVWDTLYCSIHHWWSNLKK